ncbi:MAG: tetratricopeptide repeat protein, partial [Chlamydiia bacterium]
MVNWQEILGWNEEQIHDIRSIAYAYLRQGAYDIAKDLLHLSRMLDPGHPYELQQLGAISLEEGNLKDAIQWLEEALRADPQHQPTRLNWAKALLTAGRLDEGLVVVQQLSQSQNLAIAQDA